MALLEADVNFKVVKAFVDRVRDRAMDQAVLKSLTPSQQVVKIVRDELLALFGDAKGGLVETAARPRVILMLGLQGSGKTTTTGKLAKWLSKQGRHPIVVSTDVRRPAAIQQLSVVAEKAGVRVHDPAGQMDPVARAAGRPHRGPRGRQRRRHRRHGRPAAHRRRADAGARGDQAGGGAERPALRRRRDDRAGRHQERRRVQPADRRHRRRPQQGGRRRARRRGVVGGVGRRRADRVRGQRRATRGSRAFPCRPLRVTHARHGRRAVAHREGRGSRRRRRGRAAGAEDPEGRLHARGLPRSAADAEEDGPAREHPRDAARAWAA